ncbi:MAG TPA: DedA family protein [Patescibacteria group bacterium]
MHTLNLFIHFVSDHRYLGYALMFALMIFEGELILTGAGMLVRLHAFDPIDAYLFALAGVLTGDIIWYSVGSYLRSHHSHNRYLTYAISKVKKLLPGVEKNPWHVIFISKFIYGLNHSTILVLGYLKIEFKHFLRVQFLTSFIWSLIFITIGYVFGEAALAYTHRFDRLIVLLVLFLISLAVVERVLAWVIEKREQQKKK